MSIPLRDDVITRIGSLTVRQCEVLELLLTGYSNKDIADGLGLSLRTVENHRSMMMRKMGVTIVPELKSLVLATASPSE